MRLKKYRVDKWLIICVFLFFLISVLTIGSAQRLIGVPDLMKR